MADLDDFFAKKDKKKGKATKAKFLTTEELVKNLEDTSKREAAAKPKKTETTATAVPTPVEAEPIAPVVIEKPIIPADEEWKEYEVEQRKDYSGLKIGKLQINDDDDDLSQEDEYEDGESDNNPNMDNGTSSGGVAGPWKKVIPAEEVTQIIVADSERRVYISPALRAAQGNAAIRRNRAAPDITNADFFPTLGAARPEEVRKKKNEPAFEEVRHGGRMQRVQPQAAAPVSVTNRFQGLDEDDS